MSKLEHVYSVTPEVFLSRFRPDVLNVGTRVRVATKGFSCPKRPLEGTGFTYQLAVARNPVVQANVGSASVSDPASVIVVDGEVQVIGGSGSGLPDSGDSRSGVIVFDGDKIVASYVASAITRHRHLAVDKAYRGQGLGVLMVELWLRETTFSAASIGTISEQSARIAVEAYKRVVEWAVNTGKEVPADVRAAVADSYRLERVTVRFKKGSRFIGRGMSKRRSFFNK